MEARRQWDDIFKVLKEKNCQPRILYLAKLSFKNETEIKTFLDKQKLREFIIPRPALPEMLQRVLQVKMKGHYKVTWSHINKNILLREIRYKGTNITQYNLYGIPRIDKFIETESRIELPGAEVRGIIGSYCLMDTEFLSGMMKSSGNGQW